MPAQITYTWKHKVIVLRSLARKLQAQGIPGSTIGNLSAVFAGQRCPCVTLVKGLADLEGISMEETVEMLADTARQHAEWQKTKGIEYGGDYEQPRKRNNRARNHDSGGGC